MIDVDLIINLIAALLSGEAAEHFIIISKLHFDFSIRHCWPQFIPGVKPEICCAHCFVTKPRTICSQNSMNICFDFSSGNVFLIKSSRYVLYSFKICQSGVLFVSKLLAAW